MGWWRDQVVPRMTDHFLDTEEVRGLRATVCEGLTGDVLELGFGSGLNLPHYPPTARSVAAIEPSDLAWRRARTRIAAISVPVVRAGLDGQRLSLPDDSIDTALSTFTMCTIPDLDWALLELARVLRPGGRLHFVEHGRSDDPRVQRWQDRLHGLHARVAGGCRIDRPVSAHLTRSRLRVDALETGYGQGPKVLAYRFVGVASKPAPVATDPVDPVFHQV